MKFEKDYYRILEVSPLADAAAIKKAYRQLAHRYHPDKNPENHLSEQRFREIQEAYEVLSQQSTRAHYDEWRWLTGQAYRKQRKMPTAPWLIAQAKELSIQIAHLERYEIEQPLLFDYLNFLLSEAHATILAAATPEERTQFLEWLCRTLPRLAPAYQPVILAKTLAICGSEAGCVQELGKIQEQIRQELKWRQLKPWLFLGFAVLLVILMYFWSSR